MRYGIRSIALLLLVGLSGLGSVLAEDGDKKLEGSVEVAYRSLNVGGSSEKFDEDFDGLQSGYYLSNLTANWLDVDSNVLDYARVNLIGLGGEPYEQSTIRVGRKDSYDLRLGYRKQDYIYNLFELVDDEDGHFWNTQRESTDLGLTLYPTDKLDLLFEFQDWQRSGDSLFLKDVSRDVFRLETPIDYRQKRYTFGFNLEVGEVDLVFRQTHRRYANDFVNSTEGNLGLALPSSGDFSELELYDWNQQESSSADLTSFTVHAPLGSRVDLTVSAYGTFVGDEELSSRVDVNATGTQFNASPLLIVDGFSDTELEADHTLFDADLSIWIAEPVSLHLQYRKLDRDLVGSGLADLDGRQCAATGADCSTDAECDAVTPGDVCVLSPTAVSTTLDYGIDTLTGLVEVRPISKLTLQLGYRTIDRSLDRNGFDVQRSQDFESDGDQTLLLGLSWQATDWLKLNADYEDGEVDRAFTQPSVLESERTRLRATITPNDDLRIGLSYLDFENSNVSDPFRIWYGTCAATGAVCTTDAQCDAVTPGDTCQTAPFESTTEGTNWSGSVWYRANEQVDFLARYAEQDVESATAVLFDGPGFGGPTLYGIGDTVFDNTNTQWSAQVNFSWAAPWRAWLRYGLAESDGNNLLLNDSPTGFSNDEVIDQELTDLEVGLGYTFPSGLYVGGSFRDFDYDDRNDLLDYDGQMLVLRGGFRF